MAATRIAASQLLFRSKPMGDVILNPAGDDGVVSIHIPA